MFDNGGSISFASNMEEDELDSFPGEDELDNADPVDDDESAEPAPDKMT